MSSPAFVRFVAFIFIAAVLAVGLHFAINWSLMRISIGEIGAFNQAMRGAVNADILVTGSSRAFRHFDPRILTEETGLSCFNLGRNASQVDVQLGVLKAYLRSNRRPKLLLHSVDIHSFVLTKPGQIFDPAIYVPYLSNPDLYSCLSQIDKHLWKWKYIPLYAYATKDTLLTWLTGLRTACGLSSGESCFAGFCPVDKSWTGEFLRFKKANPGGVEIGIEDTGVAALNELIELCQKEGIKVALVYSPEYHEMIGLTRNRDAIFNRFTSIAAQQNIPFLDYSYSAISRNIDLFYNSQHLNARGASVFSQDLGREIVIRGISPTQDRTSVSKSHVLWR